MAANMKPDNRADLRPLDDEMTEVALLVPSRQMEALEYAARSEGVSLGQYIRRALQQALKQFVLPSTFA